MQDLRFICIMRLQMKACPYNVVYSGLQVAVLDERRHPRADGEVQNRPPGFWRLTKWTEVVSRWTREDLLRSTSGPVLLRTTSAYFSLLQ